MPDEPQTGWGHGPQRPSHRRDLATRRNLARLWNLALGRFRTYMNGGEGSPGDPGTKPGGDADGPSP